MPKELVSANDQLFKVISWKHRAHLLLHCWCLAFKLLSLL